MNCRLQLVYQCHLLWRRMAIRKTVGTQVGKKTVERGTCSVVVHVKTDKKEKVVANPRCGVFWHCSVVLEHSLRTITPSAYRQSCIVAQ